MGYRDVWSFRLVVQDLHRARHIRANRCFSKFQESLGHGNLGGFSFDEGTFHGVDILFNKADGFAIEWA